MTEPKVKMMVGEDEAGNEVIMAPNDEKPLGMLFKEALPVATTGSTTGTTATVSVTAGPDADTDPPDSDSD